MGELVLVAVGRSSEIEPRGQETTRTMPGEAPTFKKNAGMRESRINAIIYVLNVPSRAASVRTIRIQRTDYLPYGYFVYYVSSANVAAGA